MNSSWVIKPFSISSFASASAVIGRVSIALGTGKQTVRIQPRVVRSG